MPHDPQQTLDLIAERLLDTATTALPDVGRAYIAGGPGWAPDCEQIVVNLDVARPFATPGSARRMAGSDCVVIPTPQFSVTYVRDCYPTADMTTTGKAILPDIADVTAWSTEFYARVDALWRALLENGKAGLFGHCSDVSFQDAQVTGPRGGAVWVTFPLRVGMTGEPGPSVYSG